MSKRKSYCDGDEGQEKRARGIISIDPTKDDDRSQICTPKSETNDDNDDAEFSSDQESFEDKEENYQSPLEINVQYLCKMSDGHLNFQWTFQLVHWTNGHLDVQ